jgi:Fe2+ or Zn2+ uptake regulation protein
MGQNMKTLLKEYNLKVTPQRLALLELIEQYGHIGIDDLYELMIKDFPSLSLATIYKNIVIMQDGGLLKEIKINNKKSKFEIKKEQHIHFVCDCCGSIEDKHPTGELVQFFNAMSNNNNFNYNEYSLNIYGTCESCKIEDKTA